MPCLACDRASAHERPSGRGAPWPQAALAGVVCSLLFVATALAMPVLPYAPWGTVTINGVPAPDAVPVTAWIGGVEYGHTSTIEGYYAIEVAGDDAETPEKDGGVPGDVVVFKVGGVPAYQTGIWALGASPQLDLTIGGGGPTPTRTPTMPAGTATPTRTPTHTPATPAGTATPTRTPTHGQRAIFLPLIVA